MLTVQNDWVVYEELPARRVAVRGGAGCADSRTVRPVAARSVVGGPQRVAAVRRAPAAGRPAAHRSAGRPSPVRAPRLRLTPRGRFVLVVMPALLALSGSLLVLSGQAPASASTPAAPRPAGTARTVVAGSGDSLWTIAERVAPGADPRATVAALERANGLQDGDVLPAGLPLVLPAAG